MAEPTRVWLSVADKYKKSRGQIAAEIDRLEWITTRDKEALEVPTAPGMLIKAAVAQFRIPNVTAVAYNGVLFNRYGLVGIEGNYKNGRVRIYIMDRGADALPVASDRWEAA